MNNFKFMLVLPFLSLQKLNRVFEGLSDLSRKKFFALDDVPKTQTKFKSDR